MNLEQIRNRQSSLNERLLQHLQENTQLLDHIAGEKDYKKVLEEFPRAEGLLADIEYHQDVTERLIYSLSNNQQRLSEHVYIPVNIQATECHHR